MKPCDGLLSPEQLQNLSAGQGLRGFEGKKAGTEGKKPASMQFPPPHKDSSYGITNREKEESKGRAETKNRKKVEEKIILY